MDIVAHPDLTTIRRASVAALLLAARIATAQQPTERPRAVLQSGTLSFSAHATAGAFIGSTSTVTGVVTGELPGVRGWVAAPAATLVTHNDHRDRDLRASMEVEKYPTMRFDLDGATPESLGTPGRMVLHGRLTLHGSTQLLNLPATVVQVGDTIHVSSRFPLLLGDYHVGGLTKMFGLLRMDPKIEVQVDLHFVVTEPFNP